MFAANIAGHAAIGCAVGEASGSGCGAGAAGAGFGAIAAPVLGPKPNKSIEPRIS
jgi:hypothetical protein